MISAVTSDVTTSLFSGLAKLRGGRAVHRDGIVCLGEATIEDELLPVTSGASFIRISKGLGLPGGLPDVVGIALRLPVSDEFGVRRARHWDVLLSGPVGRLGPLPIPIPATSWTGVEASTVSSFTWDGDTWSVVARLLVPRVPGGLDLTSLEDALGVGGGISLEAIRGSDRRSLGFIDITRVGVDAAVDFDPVDSTPPGVEHDPQWLGEVRRTVYRGSRVGRPDEGRLDR